MAAIKKRTIRWTTKAGESREAERWRARYVDDSGQRHSRDFTLKRDAQAWVDEQTSKLVTGKHVQPRLERTTVGEWCDLWLIGYRSRRPSTVRQAEVHLARIKAEFGPYRMADVRPSQVKGWVAGMKAEGLADSYINALHARLAQIYADALEDGIVVRSPCSRRTTPPAGIQKPYVATTEQVWALYDAMPVNLRPAVLLGAFLGTRLAEVGGLMIADLDLMRGVWTPAAQYSGDELKTATSKTPVGFAHSLGLELAAHIGTTEGVRNGEWLLCDEWGNRLAPWTIQRAMRAARVKVPGLPETFSFHDLRHYYASMLIADGADVKKVQAALRHASAKTTLDIYSHLWPDADEAIRAAGERVFQERIKSREPDVNQA